MGKKSHFVFQYKGNKHTEVDNIITSIDFANKKTIVEPFCGSSAISFNIYKIYKDNFQYILNDLDNGLYKYYMFIKYNLQCYEDFEDNLNRVSQEFLQHNDKKKFYIEIHKNNRDIYDYIFCKKHNGLGIDGLCPPDKRIAKTKFKLSQEQKDFFDFIKSSNVKIFNGEWYDIYNKYRELEDCILILDPPYAFSCNTFYIDKNIDNIYTRLSSTFYINKCTFYLIIQDLWIMRILFKDFKILDCYDKHYQLKHKKTYHIIISNKI
jgi:hypothetical protein